MNTISAYILAGGNSRRMGTDKGLLMLHQRPLISYIIEAIGDIIPTITLVSNNEEYVSFGLPMIMDRYAGLGPAAGIEAALNDTKTESIFVCSCDMPFIAASAIQHIINLKSEHEITVPGPTQHPEPMFALYQKTCQQRWEMLLLKGVLKLSDFFTHFDTNFVDRAKLTEGNPHLFMNVNTPHDLQTAQLWMNS